jgi:hypothetical protein
MKIFNAIAEVGMVIKSCIALSIPKGGLTNEQAERVVMRAEKALKSKGWSVDLVGSVDWGMDTCQIFACGPNSKCEHIWDGPIEIEKDEEGNIRSGSDTCSKCGISALELSLWEGE